MELDVWRLNEQVIQILSTLELGFKFESESHIRKRKNGILLRYYALEQKRGVLEFSLCEFSGWAFEWDVS